MKNLLPLLLLVSFTVLGSDCQGDAQKFCQGVDPGKGQLAKCLSDYSAKLTPGCAKELKAFDANTSKLNPCHKDLADFCVDVDPEPKKIEYCLLKNEARLSPSCAADFRSKKGKILVGNVCAQDVVSNCYSEVTGPEGSITKCLIRNRKKLSGFCGKEIDSRVVEMRKKNACFDETEKYCPVQVKFIDIQECLEKKLGVLTPTCKQLVQSVVDRSKANPCYRDLIRHCKPNLGPGEQDRCLDLNEKEISNSCKQFRVTESEKLKNMAKVCEPDRVKLCASAPIKDGAVVRCLREKKAQVSKECKALL